MHKADIILCVLLAIAAAAGFFYTNNNNSGSYIVITVDGKTVLNKPLSSLPASFAVAVPSGNICLHHSSSGIYVASSPCPDKLCMKQGTISASGSSIVCVPCRTAITLTNSNEHHEYDAILN